MSSEQARGRSLDRRTDVWSFGCVVFEALSGRQAFAGETTPDCLARILERAPDWAALPSSAPAWLRDLLKRCLWKDPRVRLRNIGDARIATDQEAYRLHQQPLLPLPAAATSTPPCPTAWAAPSRWPSTA